MYLGKYPYSYKPCMDPLKWSLPGNPNGRLFYFQNVLFQKDSWRIHPGILNDYILLRKIVIFSTKVSSFVWHIAFDLSGMNDATPLWQSKDTNKWHTKEI